MTNLEKLRKQIDLIDSEILSLLEKRFQTVQAIFQEKQKNNLSTKNKNRENIILKKWLQESKICPPDFIKNLVQLTLDTSRDFQEKLKK